MSSLVSPDPSVIAADVLNVLLQMTALCLIALFAARCVFRHNPSVRYFVCLAGLLCILLSPLAVCIQHKMGYGLLTLSLPVKLSTSPAPAAKLSATSSVDARTYTGVREASLTQRWIPWSIWAVLSAWAAGIVWGGARFARGWKQASSLTNGIHPWKASAHVETLDQLERILEAPIPPVFTSPQVVSPVVVRLFRPVVILPEGLAEALSPAQLRQVLLHECAHVAFRHTFGGVIERVARLLFWPHPLVHVLCRELARAREAVCDNVASQEDGAACYARTLLAMAQGMFAAPNVTSALALLGPGTSLEERIAGLLDPRRNRMVRVKRWKLWAVTGVAVSAMASTAAIRVVASEAKAKKDAVRTSVKRNTCQNPDCVSVDVQYVATGASGPAEEPLVLRRVSAHRFDLIRGGQKLGEIHVQAGAQTPAGVKAQQERAEAEGRQHKIAAEQAAEAEAKAKLTAEARAKQANARAGHRLGTRVPGASAAEERAAKLKAEAAAKAR